MPSWFFSSAFHSAPLKTRVDTEWPKLCRCVVKQHSYIHPLKTHAHKQTHTHTHTHTHIYIYIYIKREIHTNSLSIYLSIYLSISLSVCVSVCLYIHLYLYIYCSQSLSDCLSIYIHSSVGIQRVTMMYTLLAELYYKQQDKGNMPPTTPHHLSLSLPPSLSLSLYLCMCVSPSRRPHFFYNFLLRLINSKYLTSTIRLCQFVDIFQLTTELHRNQEMYLRIISL